MPRPLPNIVGKRFTRLLVISLSEKKARAGRSCWYCLCDCGNYIHVPANRLESGITRSCGCLREEVQSAIHRKHGYSKTLTGRSWTAMLYRCRQSSDQGHLRNYQEKGIVVCDGLAASPATIVEVIGECPSRRFSIDRHPNNRGNYSCGRCEQCQREGWTQNIRWATMREQMRNTSRNKLITAFSQTRLRCEWAELSGIHPTTLLRRIARGVAPEDALTTPDKFGNVLPQEYR